MKKTLIATVSLLTSLSASVSAFAASPNYSVLSQSDMNMEKFHKCICDSWKSTGATDAQNNDAKAFIEIAKTAWANHKDAIRQGKQDLVRTWSAYPISVTDVEASEMALHDHIVPVHVAMRDSTVSILNLLTADQRKTFDDTFYDCIDSGNDSLSLK